MLFRCENRKDLRVALAWFEKNGLVANPQKFQMMFSGSNKDTNLCLSVPVKIFNNNKSDKNITFFNDRSIKIGNKIIVKSVKTVKLLGVTIDDKLNFNKHIDNLCVKAKSSVSALRRISPYTEMKNLRLLITTFFMSCFSYCPLIWTFCSKSKNEKINALQKKALRLLLPSGQDFTSMLKDTKMISVHSRNLQIMMTEIYCCVNKLNPSFLWDKILPNEKNTGNRERVKNYYCPAPILFLLV